LSNVPVIGPFFRATQVGAGAASRVLSWFGFSKVPVVSDVMPFKDAAFGSLPSAETSEFFTKITLDPKAELTVDPRTVGLSGKDELAVSAYAGKEAYLTRFDWSEADVNNDILFSAYVAPDRFYQRNSSTNINFTPISHMMQCYRNWTGSVIFRFYVAATPYHRGRLRIQFDPASDISTSVGDETAIITRIVDIGECRDFEICVPWAQIEPYCSPLKLTDTTYNITTFRSDGSSLAGLFRSEHNGMISVSVSNQLTSPDSTSPLQVLVFVRAGPDFQVMNPDTPPNKLTWRSQSVAGFRAKPQADSADCLTSAETAADKMPMVFGGETNESLRQLMQRHCLWRVDAGIAQTGTTASIGVRTFNMYPSGPGASPDNLDSIRINGTISPYNMCNWTYEAFFRPAFAGVRGSMSYMFDCSNGSASNGFSVQRIAEINQPDASDYSQSIVSGSGTTSNTITFMYFNNVDTQGGIAHYNNSNQTGFGTVIPCVIPARFCPTKANRYTTTPDDITSRYTNMRTITDYDPDISVNAETLNYTFIGAGVDHALFFFIGVPTMVWVPGTFTQL
jgi:hypothetical protein